jgi:hypothetical protein
MHRVADTLLVGALDFPGSRDLPLDGSRKERREQLPLLLSAEQLIMTAAFAHRLHREDPEPIVGRDQRMHRRFGDSTLFGDLCGCPGRDLRRVDDFSALPIQGAWGCLHPLLDFFNRQMSRCTCDPGHSVPPLLNGVPLYFLYLTTDSELVTVECNTP